LRIRQTHLSIKATFIRLEAIILYPTVLGGAQIHPFDHMVLLAAITLLLEEARQLLVKVAMHSLR
jgi:hypothetical protein